MTRGFLSEGCARTRDSEDGDAGFVTVDLECGWSTDKAWGFRDPFRKIRAVARDKEKLIWVAKVIKGQALTWTGTSTGPGKLRGPSWLLTKAGLI